MRTGEVAAALFTLIGTVAAFAAPTWTTPFTLPFSQLNRPAFGFAEGGVQKLRSGRATITARVHDAAGNASETAVEVRLR